MTFTITLVQDEDRMFIAECPVIPGCVSQGATPEEAERNIRDAIRECPVVRFRIGSCTEGGDAPGRQGATTEHVRRYEREKQRRRAGCSAGRMPSRFGIGPLTVRREQGLPLTIEVRQLEVPV